MTVDNKCKYVLMTAENKCKYSNDNDKIMKQ